MTTTTPTIKFIGSLGFPSVETYQEFHGLLVDNVFGPITQKHLTTPRICSRPDIEYFSDSENQQRKWPFKELLVRPEDNISPFSITETNDILIAALQSWSDVADLNFILTTGREHIKITTGRIDGPSGTLAWSELPNQSNKVLQKYDSSEQWVLSSNPPSNKIDLLAVMVHELGHALGLVHAPSTSASTNIMAPFYNPSIREPLSGDIERIQALYGPPIETTDPNPQDPDEPMAEGKMLLKNIEFTKDGPVLTFTELPD